MAGRRLTRAVAVLVLILAQAALGLPHRMMGGAATAHAQAAAGDVAHEDCPRGAAGDASHPNAPMSPCGSCPASMPGPMGAGCLAMAGGGPSSASPGTPSLASLATVSATDFPPAISAPAAHDFIPDPPPPRA